MGNGVAFVYNEEFQNYNFSPSHPLQPIRLKLTYELCREYGLFDGGLVNVISGRTATDAELEMIHDRAYIDAVKSISQRDEEDIDFYEYGIGYGDNPAFKGMHDASSLVTGSSIIAVDQVMSGEAEHSVNISGGLHHALRNRASGFCIYNDPAVAIEYAVRKYGIRVVYLDIDAHHGDGVQWAFYDRADVLTISLHEDGRFLFPGTGFVEEIGTGEGEGFSVNLPFEPGAYDKLYVDAFDEIIPPIIRAYKPDLIVSQNGCDTHYTDPLAGLSLSTDAYEQLYRKIHVLAHEVCDGKLAALGGGGYQIFEVVPRAWTLLTADLAGVQLDEYIPSNWQALCSKESRSTCPVKLYDKPMLSLGHSVSIENKVNGVVEKIKNKVFPYFNIS